MSMMVIENKRTVNQDSSVRAELREKEQEEMSADVCSLLPLPEAAPGLESRQNQNVLNVLT